MEITTEETQYIKEKKHQQLRTLINDLATDTELEGLSEVFSWYEENNTGDIQIDCSIWAQSVVEEAIEIIKVNISTEYKYEEYNVEDLNLLNNLLDIMIEKEEGAIYLSETSKYQKQKKKRKKTQMSK